MKEWKRALEKTSAPSSIPQYKRILVPYDRSELSDRSLSHAIYLSNSTGAEIVILNIIKDVDKIEPTTISAQSGGNKEDVKITLEGQAEQLIKERIRVCKEVGAKNQISYKMQTSKKLVMKYLTYLSRWI